MIIILSGCNNNKDYDYDICVYGGTSAGVIAAYSAKMMGKSVVLVEPKEHLGGLTSGGLGFTDIGNKQVVTGLSKDFYRRIGEHYGKLEQWIFEPKVADSIFHDYIKRADINTMFKYELKDVYKIDSYIKKIELSNTENRLDTKTISAKVFIDCTYEGDLMAKSKVSYVIGRESNSKYNETLNGVQLMDGHQFPDGIDPYIIPGDSSSGLLWGISNNELKEQGSGDTLIQAYNYRICLTNDKNNMIEITKPDNYDSKKYELLLRLFQAQPDKRKLNDYFIWSIMPNSKTDINNRGGFSTDMIGENYNYIEASYDEREKIIQSHIDYTKGLLYFYKSDPRVPECLRKEMGNWGYPKDEYVTNGNWSPQLYVRECRRMLGKYVMTQSNCQGKITVSDGIGMAAYTMDSHNCQRIVVRKNGKDMVKNEGNVEVGGGFPYPISYNSIIPKDEECKNLLVPVCLSASHIAYGSIRMEPVFMVLAQSAAIAAVEALRVGSVQSVNVDDINKKLYNDPYLDGRKNDILLDDTDVNLDNGAWKRVRKTGGYGPTYLERVSGKNASIEYIFNIPDSGKYKLYSYIQKRKQLVNQIRYDVKNGISDWTKIVNKDNINIHGQTVGEWVELGEFEFDKKDNTYVKISSDDIDRILIADALCLIPIF